MVLWRLCFSIGTIIPLKQTEHEHVRINKEQLKKEGLM